MEESVQKSIISLQAFLLVHIPGFSFRQTKPFETWVGMRTVSEHKKIILKFHIEKYLHTM